MQCKVCCKELLKIQDSWTDGKVQWDHHLTDTMDELWVLHKAEHDISRINRIGLLE